MYSRLTFFRIYMFVGMVLVVTYIQSVDTFSTKYILLFYAFWIALYYGVKYWYRSYKKNKHIKSEREYKAKIEAFKQDAELIIVDMDKCEIKSNNYTDEHYEGEGKGVSIGSIQLPSYTYSYQEAVKNDVKQTVLVYTHDNGGKEEVYTSPILPVDKVSLLFLLDVQDALKLYVDKHSRDRYYFDFDFLKQ